MHKDDPFDRLLERTSRADREGPHESCLDAETLAAWADGSLTAHERALAETHAADCERCLTVLASIARTSPPPVTAQRPSWLSVRWLVPLTTAAVAIAAWMVVQGPPLDRQVQRSEAPAVDAVKPSAPGSDAERDAGAANRVEALQKKADAPARVNPKEKEQEESRRANASGSRKQTAASDKLAAATRRPVETPPAAASPSASTLSRLELKDERVTPQTRAFAQAPNVIASPDPNVRWRVTARLVERSTDGGRTWQAQSTGTDIDLLSGASPSPTVCWIVGRGGLVLLSTDGATWRRVDFPDRTVDLAGVVATSALEATVTTASGRSYRTSDAGRTWTLQETPAAPF